MANSVRLKPMIKEARDRIAVRMHLMVEECVRRPCFDSFNALSREMAVMAGAVHYPGYVPLDMRDDPAAKAVVSMLTALEYVQKRYTRAQRWGMTGDELAALRASVARCDEALALIPYPIYEAARINMEEQTVNDTEGKKI